MQLVGTSCEKCADTIRMALDVKGCQACGKVYHDGCLEQQLSCPDCGVAYTFEEPVVAPPPKPLTCARCGMLSPPGSTVCDCGQELNSAKSTQIRQQSLSAGRATMFIGGAMMALSLIATTYTALVMEESFVMFHGLLLVGAITAGSGWRQCSRLKG